MKQSAGQTVSDQSGQAVGPQPTGSAEGTSSKITLNSWFEGVPSPKMFTLRDPNTARFRLQHLEGDDVVLWIHERRLARSQPERLLKSQRTYSDLPRCLALQLVYSQYSGINHMRNCFFVGESATKTMTSKAQPWDEPNVQSHWPAPKALDAFGDGPVPKFQPKASLSVQPAARDSF